MDGGCSWVLLKLGSDKGKSAGGTWYGCSLERNAAYWKYVLNFTYVLHVLMDECLVCFLTTCV